MVAFYVPITLGVPKLPSVAYTDNEMQTGSTTTHTFTGKSIGTASSTRTVLVMWYQGSTSTSFSMTINGNAATQVVNADVVNRHFRVFALTVPTGTTATIVTTTDVAGLSFIVVYAAYDLQSTTATDSNSGVTAGASLSLNLNVAANGIAIGYASITALSTYTWTGLVKQFEASLSGSPDESQSGATYTATAAQSPLAVTVARPSSGVYGFAASFR